MIAVISDIHGNLEALEAVLADVDRFPVKQLYCLGDIVGYGPNPSECVDLVSSRCRISVLGDFESMLWDRLPEDSSQGQQSAVEWTRRQLNTMPAAGSTSDSRWEFLWSLRPSFVEGSFLFVHGSPRQPTFEYVFPEDIYNRRKMELLFECFESYCIVGHTHLPGVFPSVDEFVRPEDCSLEFRLTRPKALINVGSVGQPRDGDARACYVLLNEDRVVFRRVDYDVDTTMRKLRGMQ
jgi:diadenosine tetraphosphatase ApaH/serine/threonine PP2A family protein phosphatase